MKSPIRVLQIVTKMDRAGLETMLMNYYRHIDRNKVQFDFLTHRKERGAYDDEIESLGGKIYRTYPISPKYMIQYQRKLQKFFHEHPEYRIVHSHIDALSIYPLLAAMKAGVPVRIAHSHTTNFDMNFQLPFRLFSKKLIPLVATNFWGCGKKAIEFMFGDRIGESEIVPNAIDIKKYLYNSNTRVSIRKMLRIEDKFVIGHVGRFSYPKNHEFLIDIFAEVHRMNSNSVLMLVGDGEEKEKIIEKVNHLGLQNYVLFMGVRSDIPDLMQAMDVFLLPSRFEGIPVVLIEAQAAALPCLASKDVIPEEVNVTGLIRFLSLDAPVNKWAVEILKSTSIRTNNVIYSLQEGGYDIITEAHELGNRYLTLW